MQEVHCEEIFIILIYFKMAFVTKLTTGLRTLSTNVSLQAPIKEFVVIGGGLMGAGIAQVGAQTGHKVTLVDLSQVSQGNSFRGIDIKTIRLIGFVVIGGGLHKGAYDFWVGT